MVSVEGKRMDSLARNRASAELKRRHPEEWARIFRAFRQNLEVEKLMLGKVSSSRAVTLHLDNGDGFCEHCGSKTPCPQMKQRERERVGRLENPVEQSEHS